MTNPIFIGGVRLRSTYKCSLTSHRGKDHTHLHRRHAVRQILQLYLTVSFSTLSLFFFLPGKSKFSFLAWQKKAICIPELAEMNGSASCDLRRMSWGVLTRGNFISDYCWCPGLSSDWLSVSRRDQTLLAWKKFSVKVINSWCVWLIQGLQMIWLITKKDVKRQD